MTLKSTFTSLNLANQCIFLAGEYNKPFEYVYRVPFTLNETNKKWEACIWDPRNRVVADIIVAIDIEDIDEPKRCNIVLVAETHDSKLDIARSSNGEIEVPLCGIPNVALQYTRLLLVCDESRVAADVYCRVLPEDMRRRMAQTSHQIPGGYTISCGMMKKNKDDIKMCVIC